MSDSECVYLANIQTHKPHLQEVFVERFWKRVRIGEADECWEWTAYRRKEGYGKVGVTFGKANSKTLNAHRIAYLLYHGELPLRLSVLHTCDNPPCCNPTHLFLGTQAENLEDMHRKGRYRFKAHSGEENGNAKLSWEKVREVRQKHARGEKLRTLASEFGVSESTIKRIVYLRGWMTTNPEESEVLNLKPDSMRPKGAA